mgnify:CR=1 FL=1
MNSGLALSDSAARARATLNAVAPTPSVMSQVSSSVRPMRLVFPIDAGSAFGGEGPKGFDLCRIQ